MRPKYSAILLIAFAILMAGTVYELTPVLQEQQPETLTTKIARADDLLQKGRDRASTLEQQLAATNRAAAKQISLPHDFSSATVFDAVLRLAEGSQVRVVGSSAQPVAKENSGKYSYTRMPFNVQVEGDVSRLLAFAGRFEKELFRTLVVNEVSLSESKEGKGMFRLSLNFLVYVFPPISSIESTTQ